MIETRSPWHTEAHNHPRFALPDLEPFQSGTLRGRRHNGKYEVYSYAVLIASYDMASGDVVYTESPLSVTSTRHRNLVRKLWDSRFGNSGVS